MADRFNLRFFAMLYLSDEKTENDSPPVNSKEDGPIYDGRLVHSPQAKWPAKIDTLLISIIDLSS